MARAQKRRTNHSAAWLVQDKQQLMRCIIDGKVRMPLPTIVLRIWIWVLIAELRGEGAAARSSSSSQPQTHPNSGGHTNIYPSDGSSHTMPKDCAPRTAVTPAMARTAPAA